METVTGDEVYTLLLEKQTVHHVTIVTDKVKFHRCEAVLSRCDIIMADKQEDKTGKI